MLEVPLPKPFLLECNSSAQITAKSFFLCISLLLPNMNQNHIRLCKNFHNVCPIDKRTLRSSDRTKERIRICSLQCFRYAWSHVGSFWFLPEYSTRYLFCLSKTVRISWDKGEAEKIWCFHSLKIKVAVFAQKQALVYRLHCMARATCSLLHILGLAMWGAGNTE